MRPSRVHVRGLPLPVLLIESMASGTWPAQDDTRLREIMPWFEDPLDLLVDVQEMRRESAFLDWMTEDGATADLFRQARGSQAADLIELPWLDADLAVLIGVNRNPGDDVALALDYRTGSDDPRVVASDWWTDPHRCAWRVVAPTFSAFINALGIDPRRCYQCLGPEENIGDTDAPGEPIRRPRKGTAVGDIVSGTVVADERPFGPRIRLDGDASMPAYIRDFPWKGKRSDAVSVGQRVTAEVVSIDDAAGHVWLSLAATEDPELWKFLKGLHAGEVLTGTVAAIRDFGVFIALDQGPPHPSYPGVGFVTVPELTWEHFDEVTDIVRVGQRVRGEVLQFDTTNGEARLSLRTLSPDPFQVFADNTAVGQRLSGTVTKVIPFGVFVEVAAGIQGLIHKDDLADVPFDTPEQVVQPGAKVQATVIDLDRDRRRLRLARSPGHASTTPATERQLPAAEK